MLKIFLDFDDVLFNTRDFVVDYKKIFSKFGITEKLFQKYYYGYPVKKGKKLLKYSPYEHLKRIKENSGIDTKKLKKDIDNFAKDTAKYVFPDVVDFLKNFPKKELLLLSYGETKFQDMKIMNSGITGYFSKIIVGDKLKSEMIKNLIKDSDTNYLLEDRVEQITDVEKRFPFVKTILLKRPEGRYQDKKNKYCEVEAENLAEVLKIIKN